MSTISSQYSQSPLFNVFGVVTGSSTLISFPNVPCMLARFKAFSNNVGSFLLGGYFEMDSGDDSGWLSLNNLNQISHSDPSGTLDRLAYWVQR